MNRRPKNVILPLLLFLSTAAPAQLPLADPVLESTGKQAPRWVVKVAPLSLLDPDNTIQFGLERLLNDRHSLQGEFGYGWRAMNLYQGRREDFDAFEVWRSRIEWRLYSNRYRARRKVGPPLGFYIGADGFFKQLTVRDEFNVGRDCGSGNGACAYFERMTLPAAKYTWGAHFKLGRQFSIDAPDVNRLVMDFYFGLGFRNRTVRMPSLPENGTIPFQNSFNLLGPFSSGEGAAPSLTTGFKIGYVF